MARCKSCAAPIMWVRTVTGKRIPLDAKPVDGGNIHLDDDGNAIVRSHSEPTLFGPPHPEYVSHFATCPDAAEFRKPTQTTRDLPLGVRW